MTTTLCGYVPCGFEATYAAGSVGYLPCWIHGSHEVGFLVCRWNGEWDSTFCGLADIGAE